jgi:hypothetical protein
MSNSKIIFCNSDLLNFYAETQDVFILNYWQCSYRVVGPTTTTTTTTPTTVIPATTTSPAPKTTAVPVAYNGEGSCHSKVVSEFPYAVYRERAPSV